MSKKIDLEKSWLRELRQEFDMTYMLALKSFLKQEKSVGQVIFPKGKDIFNAFNTTPFDSVKVVILGQDPYHGEGQAHGMAFSVNDGVRQPPSLVNIFKELANDIEGFKPPSSGNLEAWAKQGVFLLNATLTVRRNSPGSHQNKGWEQFTDKVIQTLSDKKEHLVFLLWGRYARNKKVLIDGEKHLVLEAAHPSPYSADSGFFGCGHFSQANRYLESHHHTPIQWNAVL